MCVCKQVCAHIYKVYTFLHFFVSYILVLSIHSLSLKQAQIFKKGVYMFHVSYVLGIIVKSNQNIFKYLTLFEV